MEVSIDPRFCGPDNSGNGGYSCGMLGQHIQGPSKVRLMVPPPLNTPLQIVIDGEQKLLMQGETTVGSATPCTMDVSTVPPAPTLERARAARQGYTGHLNSVYPRCFVCGTNREPHDGLCLFTGAVENSDLVACDWQPQPDLLDSDENIKTEFIWAALDCPGFFALREPLSREKMFLLGQLAVEVLADIPGDNPLVVYAWKERVEGRKYFSGSAIASAEGQILAHSEQVWLELKSIQI